MQVSTRTLVAAAIFALVGPPEGGHYVRAAAAQQRFLPAEIEAGGRLYFANCTGCHGPEGDGVAGTNFSKGQFRRRWRRTALSRPRVRPLHRLPRTRRRLR